VVGGGRGEGKGNHIALIISSPREGETFSCAITRRHLEFGQRQRIIIGRRRNNSLIRGEIDTTDSSGCWLRASKKHPPSPQRVVSLRAAEKILVKENKDNVSPAVRIVNVASTVSRYPIRIRRRNYSYCKMQTRMKRERSVRAAHKYAQYARPFSRKVARFVRAWCFRAETYT